MTFDQLTRGCTPAEREALAWHLAMMRARKTVEALLKEASDADVLLEIANG